MRCSMNRGTSYGSDDRRMRIAKKLGLEFSKGIRSGSDLRNVYRFGDIRLQNRGARSLGDAFLKVKRWF